MKNLIDDVKHSTPKLIPGYTYIKTQNIYIPFMKVTVECLTRKTSELNLFFESILRLIEISVTDINEIAHILGVTYNIVKEAVIDMVGIDYIYTSETNLGITPKGAIALKTKQRVDITKTYLKDIMIDTITGVVHDSDAIKVSLPRQRDVLLESAIEIDGAFLDSHFQDINCVYQSQLVNDSIFGDRAATSELYKIIGISHSELQYVENRIFIFKSETSDELRYEFAADNKDLYKGEFYNQLKDSYRPCQEYFFEKSRDLINNYIRNPIKTDKGLLSQTEETQKLLFTNNLPEDTLIEAYRKERYSLNDLEYMSCLYHHKSLRSKKIVVCTNQLNALLSPAFCSQLNVIAENIPVYLIYHKSEYNITTSLNRFFKNPSKLLFFIPSNSIEENLICFDSELVMHLEEHVAPAFERHISFMRSRCTFDKNRNATTLANLFQIYSLGKYTSSKIEKNRKSDKRSQKHGQD